jgi:uncharacterized membrane protein
MLSRRRPCVPRAAATLAIALVTACSTADLPTDPPAAPSAPELAIATFGITTIGQPEEGIRPAGINDQGLVVGTLAPDGAVWRVFQWSNGGIQVLPTSSANGGIGFGQNAFGLAVGIDGPEAVVWEHGTRSALVDPDAGATPLVAMAASNSGQIVGWRELTGISKRLGLVWTGKTDQHPVSLLTLEGRDASPDDMNDAGMIVGAINGLGAAVWSDKLAVPQLLPDPDGHGVCDEDGNAAAINERGEIVGECGDSPQQQRAAYWPSKDAQAVALGHGSATAINDLGQIVGVLNDRPTLWNREAGQLRAYDLGSASSEPGLIRVTGVNNTGQVVGMHFTSAGPIAMVWRIPIRLDLDLVPGSSANAVRIKGSGSVGAVILGSRWFRAADVDPATLTLGNDDGFDAPVVADRRGKYPAPSDVNRDGFPDLTIQFDKAALIRNGDIAVGDRTLVLLGRTKDGKQVRGTDVVHVTP